MGEIKSNLVIHMDERFSKDSGADFTVKIHWGNFYCQPFYGTLPFPNKLCCIIILKHSTVIQKSIRNTIPITLRLRSGSWFNSQCVCVCVLQIYTISCMCHCTTSWSGVPFIAIISKRMNDLNRIVIWINQHGEWNKFSNTINMTDTSQMEMIMRNFIFNM